MLFLKCQQLQPGYPYVVNLGLDFSNTINKKLKEENYSVIHREHTHKYYLQKTL